MKTGILKRGKTAFVLVDLQESFRPVVSDFGSVVKKSQILVMASQILDVPLLVTEQYPKGLKETVSEVELPEGSHKFEKTSFGCFGCSGFLDKLKKLKIEQLVIFGIEAHVCVLNTALEAVENGLEVHVVADAVSSRTAETKQIALDRLRQSGVFVDCTESVLFQLLETANAEEFKEISRLVK